RPARRGRVAGVNRRSDVVFVPHAARRRRVLPRSPPVRLIGGTRSQEATVPVISHPHGFTEDSLYVDLRPIVGQGLFLKCEGFNFAGSIKLKAAAEMVDSAERDGVLLPGSIIVESSSGNLGVALSMIAASKGYRFLCVTDSRCSPTTRRLMEALGAQVRSEERRVGKGGWSRRSQR